jgi:hypothetical protein
MSGISPSYVLECVAESVFAEVRFNDVPLFRSDGVKSHSLSTRVNAYALGGGNLTRVLLRSYDPPAARPKFVLSIYRMMDKDQIWPIAQFRYQPGLHRVEKDGLTEVFRHTCTFADDFGPWAFEAQQAYDAAERAEVIAGVQELHAALEQKDFDRFVELNRTKLEELARAQGKPVGDAVDAQKKWLNGLFRLDTFAMAPLEPESLSVEGVAQGRLVWVKSPRGQEALRAMFGADDMAFDTMMMRQGGRWVPAR